MRAGSHLISDMSAPSCQVLICQSNSSGYLALGAGVRVDNYIVAPSHVMAMEVDLVIRGKNGAFLDISSSQVIEVAADLVAVELSETAMSRLGVAKPRLGVLGASKAVSLTSSVDCRSSTGILGAKSPMGRCEYTGSTTPGFSGAGYMDGSILYGMHQGGGNANYGLEALYIWSRLKVSRDERPEQSEDFLFGSRAAAQATQAEEIGDHAVVRSHDGHYLVISAEDYLTRKRDAERRLETDNWADQVEAEEQLADLKNVQIVESAAFSGEGQGSQALAPPASFATSQGSKSLGKLGPSKPTLLKAQLRKFVQLPRTQRTELLTESDKKLTKPTTTT